MKTKKQKTYSVRLVGGLFAVCLIATLSITTLAYGAISGTSLKEMIAQVAGTIVGNSLTEQFNQENIALGGVTWDEETFQDDVKVKGTLIAEGDVAMVNSDITMTEFYEVIEFEDATITPVVYDVTENFYLTDMWLENSGKATTSVRICVSTTTATFVAQDDYTYLTDDAGTCTLMRTLGNAFGADGATSIGYTATSSPFFWTTYPGTDTGLVLATQKLPIWIASSTNILVYATSSSASGDGAGNYGIVGANNTFAGKLHFRGFRFEGDKE